MKQLQLTALALLIGSAALAQTSFEGGIKGAGTFTNGHTTIPPISISSLATIPQLENKGNGTGTGYSFGVWGRKNFSSFYVQVEATYNNYKLYQKADITIPAALAFGIAGTSLPSQIPAATPTAIAITSESILESVNVPILFGKKFADDRFRVFVGPTLLFTTKASATRNNLATIGTNSLSFPQTTTDLKNPNRNDPTQVALEVKPFTYAAEVGVGYTLGRILDIDARYAVPVGGIYKNKDIKGYLGIASLSLGLKLF
ncbi:outer membrane beta-barrel protein [Spirosoma rhododendri]|uniref:PorT family protein n=1 Tax=Spirosoma rhododendri TaxID=2728024 RepID=A0A7L5DMP0_9BACT|nr:outer membrane beta-barrel protein [Spirosoma rhododendri]QJD79385.1 PorT family protein [Spirosoma rhododendri]